MVLPPRVRGESHGRPVRRGSSDRLRTDALGRTAALRRRQDVAGPPWGHRRGRDPRPLPIPPVPDPRALVLPSWSVPRFFSGDALIGLLAIIVITPALHRAVNLVGYRMGKKREPW